ncbi:MAG: SagB/ThcOx family dehydrogenase [Planctomycetota bacterium]
MSIAQAYHALTKYTEDNVRGGPELDWSRQPAQFKQIVSQNRVSLRPYLPVRLPGQDASMPVGGSHESLARLSRLLYFSNGLTGLIRYGPGQGQFLRAAPSAGALYPTETYVAVHDVAGLAPGIYNYQAPTHDLVLLWEDDPFSELKSACGDAQPFDDTGLCLIFTGLFWRSAWRYQERGYRRVLLDTGHVLGNLLAYAPDVSAQAHLHLGFVDPVVNSLFFFDDSIEGTLACVPITDGDDPATHGPLWTSAAGDGDTLQAATLTAESDLAASATVTLHRSSSCWESHPGAKIKKKEVQVSERSIPLAAPDPLDVPRVILRRRSARSYTGASIPLDAFGQSLGYSLGRADGARAVHLATRNAGLLDCHVVVLEVEGLDPGLYTVEGAGEALLPLAMGSFRDRLLHLSLGQEIAQRCAAIVIYTAPADESVAAYGDRAYRYLHLEAGIAGERLQLAAQSHGLGACGIGGFFDDEVATLVDRNANDFVLYLVTIGRSGDQTAS